MTRREGQLFGGVATEQLARAASGAYGDPGLWTRPDGDDTASDTCDTSDTWGEAELLHEVARFVARFVRLPSGHDLVTVALWVAHAHVFDRFDSTPRLAVLSPVSLCGKTRLLEVVETLVPNPLRSESVSTAVLFRRLGSDEPPVVLLDECDAIWTGRGIAEDLRSLVNAGHRQGGSVLRMVGEGAAMEPKAFSTFGPMCLAGIGNLPGTVMNRSVVITMQRRLPSERVEPWRFRTTTPEGHALRDRLAAWLGSLPDLPYPEPEPTVQDRAWDVWEPLIMIAEAAGGDWPALARAACQAKVAEAETGDAASTPKMRLLADVLEVWPATVSFAYSTDLVGRLCRLDGAPWSRDPVLTPKRMATLLHQFGVAPKQHEGRGARGYYRSDLERPWATYVPGYPSPHVSQVSQVSRDAGEDGDEAARLLAEVLGAEILGEEGTA